APASVGACNPLNVATTDGGYNLDDDGTCISADTPAVGSHSGIAAYGSSTYGAMLDAYLGGLGNHGGPTSTIPLLNSPYPSSTLTNPAFAVVPPSFDLPFAVDGETAACAVSDQRGLFPAAGLNCDIGSYLLQATSTALAASAPAVAQNGTITYTATVAPAPDGGTVSFDDGAGHPASVHCAAQGLSAGTATCTVPYAAVGTYPVTATYSGDGTMNNYESSASTGRTVTVTAPVPPPAAAVAPVAPPVAPASDRTPPMTTLQRVTSTKQPITLRGVARDDGTVSIVRVSVALHVGRLCRFLAADHTLTKARSCDRTSYLDAKGTSAWSLKLPKLPAGRYTVWTRGIDAAGNIERKRRSRNVLVVRIPVQKQAAAKKPSTARSAATPVRVAVLAS
ncbi:MAG TPA: Ig-like domain-containing protein, partial [Baekduia sp.]